MFAEILLQVKEKKPLVHNITNYVTANDCANILLACGASPVMADNAIEVEEITSHSDGLNINIGTLNERTIESMKKAGKQSNALGHPIVFDPVGVGASSFRMKTAKELIEQLNITVIRGNISEMKTLAYGSNDMRGVDANLFDSVTAQNLADMVKFAKDFAKKTGAILAISGAIDLVADETKAYAIYNGHPMMRSVTGTGCQLSALSAGFLSANSTKPLTAIAAAVCAMGICGETAYERMTDQDGNASYRNYIINAMYQLTPEVLEQKAKYEQF